MEVLCWAQVLWCSFSVLSSFAIALVKRVKELVCLLLIEPRHEVSNNMVFATSKTSDHPGHTHSLNRAFASHLNILRVLSY